MKTINTYKARVAVRKNNKKIYYNTIIFANDEAHAQNKVSEALKDLRQDKQIQEILTIPVLEETGILVSIL